MTFDPRSLTGAQLRAARALVDITASEMALRTGLGVATLLRAESGSGQVSMTAANAHRVVEILAELGVEFIAANGGGAGVRFKQP